MEEIKIFNLHFDALTLDFEKIEFEWVRIWYTISIPTLQIVDFSSSTAMHAH